MFFNGCLKYHDYFKYEKIIKKENNNNEKILKKKNIKKMLKKI